MERSEILDASLVEKELAAARQAGRAMLPNALVFLQDDGALLFDDLLFLGFIERAKRSTSG